MYSLLSLLCLGLPPSGSWQDLKDHMREAGDVCFADVFKDGTGVVEFLRYEDMKYAFKKLDDSRFRSHEVIVCNNILEVEFYVPRQYRHFKYNFSILKTLNVL